MTPMAVISVALSGLIFLMWAVSMFTTLIALRKRTVARTGTDWPGPAAALHEWGIWLRAPEFARDRRQLALMTLAVFALGGLTALNLTTTD